MKVLMNLEVAKIAILVEKLQKIAFLSSLYDMHVGWKFLKITCACLT